jgi:hypothetical protein
MELVLNYVLASVCVTYIRLFGLKLKDASSLYAFNSVAVYGIMHDIAKQEGLEFKANKCVLGVALIYSHHRIVLEARIV